MFKKDRVLFLLDAALKEMKVNGKLDSFLSD